MLLSLLSCIIYWIAIGISIMILHCFVYFRGIDNLFENYQRIEKFKNLMKEVRELEKSDKIDDSSLLIAFIIVYSFLGPFSVIQLMIDFVRFTILGK